MMNTRKLNIKTIKAVKDGVNAAIARHRHSIPLGNFQKAAEHVPPTSSALLCFSYGKEGAKQCDHQQNENVISSMIHLPYQQKGMNSQFRLPFTTNQLHPIPFNMANSSSENGALPASYQCRRGIMNGNLRPKYDKSLMSQQNRMMSTRAVNANRGTIEGIITTLNDKFNADIVNETQAIYQFNILSGDRREIYYIDLRNGSGSAGKGKSEGSPDTIFSIDAENFNRLVEGNLRAPTAYMTGRMKISGSMQKAAKLEKLFATLLDK